MTFKTFAFIASWLILCAPPASAQDNLQCLFRGSVLVENVLPSSENFLIQVLTSGMEYSKDAIYNSETGEYGVSLALSDGFANGDTVHFRFIHEGDTIPARTSGDDEPLFFAYPLPYPPELKNVDLFTNGRPVIVSTPPDVAREDSLFVYQVEAVDPDHDALSFSLDDAPEWLTIDASSGLMSGTPGATDTGTVIIRVGVSDGFPDGDDEQEFALHVFHTNHVPSAIPRNITTPEDRPAFITLRGSDPDHDALAYNVVTPPSHGSLTIIPRIIDGVFFARLTGDQEVPPNPSSALATGVFVLNPTADTLAYVIVARGFQTGKTGAHFHNASAGVNGPIVRGIFPHASDTLRGIWTRFDLIAPFTADLLTEMRNGRLYVNLHTQAFPNGEIRGQIMPVPESLLVNVQNLVYTPQLNYHGPDAFTFSVSDGSLNSDPATVDISVVAVNDPPSTFRLLQPADLDTVQLFETPRPVTFSWNPSHDVDGDTLTYTLNIFGLHGPVTIRGEATVSLDIMHLMQPGTMYVWTVQASDGGFEAASPDTLRFFTSDSIILGIERSAGIPDRFGLEQNWPNPFNPITNVGFRIIESGPVRLTVYDLLGRAVATLVEETLQPGVYSVRWDGGGLSSGVYLYRLMSGKNIETRKLLLSK